MLHISYFDTQNVEVLSHDDVNHKFIRSVVFEQKRLKVLRLKMGHPVRQKKDKIELMENI